MATAPKHIRKLPLRLILLVLTGLLLLSGCLASAIQASTSSQPDNSRHVFVCNAAYKDSAECGYKDCYILWVPAKLLGAAACKNLLGQPVTNALVITRSLLVPLVTITPTRKP